MTWLDVRSRAVVERNVPSTIITETWRKVSLEVEDSELLLSRAEPALEASNESAFYRIPFLSKEVRRELAASEASSLLSVYEERIDSTDDTHEGQWSLPVAQVQGKSKSAAAPSEPAKFQKPRAGPLRWLESTLTDDKGIVRCCCCAAWGCRWRSEVVQN
jgi:hypothetical protein